MEKDVKSVEDFNKEKELLRVKKKYSPKYILTAKLAEVYLIFLLFIAICFASKKIAYGFLGMVALILSVLGFLIISKKNAKSNYISFYDDKVVYKGKKLWWDSERTLKYSEIKDITFTQGSSFFEKRIQKLMNLGNIYVVYEDFHSAADAYREAIKHKLSISGGSKRVPAGIWSFIFS